MKHKVALVVGRFQPFHNGHLYLLHKALEHADKVIIGIGSTNLHDEKNPMNFEKRKKMVEEVIGNEVIGNRVIKIVPLDDFFNDQKWFDNTVKQAGKFDLVIGDNEWVNHIFEERGYKILQIGFYKRYLLEGEKIRKLMEEGRIWQERVPKYIVSLLSRYNHGILGGTFDHLHVGHKKLIDEAIRQSQKLSIGIVKSSKLLDKNFSNSIEPYQKRFKNLSTYVEQSNKSAEINIIPIIDIYGSTLKDKTIDAIFVTKDTRRNAEFINKKRVQIGFSEMKIVEVPFKKSTDGEIISSERIRSGEINRKGLVYSNLLSKTLCLPTNLRESLRKPLGYVIKGNENELNTSAMQMYRYIDRSIHSLIVAVGDIITQSMIDAKRIPDISIIDFRSRRKPIERKVILASTDDLVRTRPESSQMDSGVALLPRMTRAKISNPPGTINYKFAPIFQKAVNSFIKTNKKQLIVVDGEEDLLTLPAILLAPLGSVVLYGQYDLGVVGVEVTEEKKKFVANLLNKFKKGV